MVSQDSPVPNSTNSSFMHQFIIPNSMPDQTHFPNDPFGQYGPNNNAPYPHPLPHERPDMSHGRPLMNLLGPTNDPTSSNPTQRLSLSLGSTPCRQIRPFLSPCYINPGLDRAMMGDYSFSANDNAFAPLNSFNNVNNHTHHPHPSCSTSYCQESFTNAIGSSRYLKSAQSLLLEMVSVVGKEIEPSNRKYVEKLSRAVRKGYHWLPPDVGPEFSDSELCICMLKLLSLLDEVERRYEEYYHHIEDLVTSFEMIAGLGSASAYTALALQAMSKHFWTLRNAVVAQIRAARLKIEKDWPKISSTLSGLSLLDQEGRHNPASLQQIGLMHNSRQAWRPIRGLPETSVTILRAWLFEHFLHPYPNDSEKLMLASQTCLSKNQVSNWFINARVRLWKPMIEEMYKEEFAESDQLPTSTEGVGDSGENLI